MRADHGIYSRDRVRDWRRPSGLRVDTVRLHAERSDVLYERSPRDGAVMQPITIIAVIAILALLVIAILMGHSHASDAVIFVGGAVVVAVARMLTARRNRRR